VEEPAQVQRHHPGEVVVGVLGKRFGDEHSGMEVYASCGTKVGKVDHVEGDLIKLTKNDSPDGQHPTIPLSRMAKVHDHIHLSKDHREVESQWQPA
jgi:hypothetical protein